MQIEWNGSTLYYSKSGNGPETLLLFHGFGQDHTVFSPLLQALPPVYTCYAFDLFFHGQSSGPEKERPITKEAWQSIMHTFLQSERIQRFSLLGFSIGARLVLATLETFPHQVNHVYLMAPDGIVNNVWFSVATSTLPGRWLFRRFVNNPSVFAGVTGFLSKLKIADPKLLRFATRQMETPDKTKKVFLTWMTFRKLTFRQHKICGLLNEFAIPVFILLGNRDYLIGQEHLKKFTRKLDTPPTLHIIPAGHNQLISEMARDAARWFKGESEIQH